MSGKEYWEERSASYIQGIEGSYHRNRLRMVEALLRSQTFQGKACLDFGCGDGVFAEHLLSDGATVMGVDVDSVMVAAASKRLATRWPSIKLAEGGVEQLKYLPDGAFDYLFALNVLAYLNAEEEVTFYREAARLVKPGGGLVITHSNELFDMFTFNRYTVNFFHKHFSIECPCDVSELLTCPDKPNRFVFAVRENPLCYRHKLKAYGFSENRQEFAILHQLPPLLTPTINFDDIDSRAYLETTSWPEEDRWKLMFMCSVFGSFATRNE